MSTSDYNQNAQWFTCTFSCSLHVHVALGNVQSDLENIFFLFLRPSKEEAKWRRQREEIEIKHKERYAKVSMLTTFSSIFNAVCRQRAIFQHVSKAQLIFFRLHSTLGSEVGFIYLHLDWCWEYQIVNPRSINIYWRFWNLTLCKQK